MRAVIPALRALLVAVLTAHGVACGRPDAPASAAGDRSGTRIVSLSPALTHTVERLGGAGAIVGCTPWCRAEGAEVVGSLEDRDIEAIVSLKPSLVLRQSGTPDPALEKVLAARGVVLRSWTLASLAEVKACMPEVAAALVDAGITGAGDDARRIIDLHAAAIVERVATTGPVLFLYSTDPPAAFGAGSYVDELWRAMGGRNAVAAPGYPALAAEDLASLGADAVVVIGPLDPPSWLSVAAPVRIAIDAPELLEPGADMLTRGPDALRAADRRMAGASR